ncbi:Alpha/Beta hydrolase protein [Chaetomidium leptoderma]|uniref:Kynurenine formamidase n=1 Tax=Chaetomidium leptoderma TaxID=669021 RepID=A0AAN6VMZ4_9PEZI|nr:Alpha/Beta hydrolase protein [Chaetomidium leptoderma]
MQSQASAADLSAWASVPWSPVTDPDPDPDAASITTGTTTGTTADTPIGWHKAGVPYIPSGKALSLQTLDVWIPSSGNNHNAPDASSLPHLPGTWIIYIHGGAWRDPAISASSFTPAATNLLLRAITTSTTSKKIAGLVSLNYRLSPHPHHPSPPNDDPARQARHPDHITDILTALAYLHRLGIITKKENWILAGHSCGATLAFQAVMSPARWGLSPDALTAAAAAAAVVGFNGLYDLAGFIASPPRGYEHLCEAYREFVSGAFGEEEEGWRAVCPATAGAGGAVGWVGEWVGDGDDDDHRKRGQVVLVQSREDTLVPYQQLEVMRAVLEGEERVAMRVMEAGGDHDVIWREGGGRMAEILWEVVEGL